MQFNWSRRSQRSLRQTQAPRSPCHAFVQSKWRPTLERLEDRLAPATAIWTGAGINNLWSTPGNWQEQILPQPGDDLLFPNAAQLSNLNDLPVATPYNSITFTAGGYTLNGTVLLLHSGITTSNLSGTNTIGFYMGLLGSQTINSLNVGSTLTLNGPLELGSTTLEVTGAGAINFGGTVTGLAAATLVKSGTGRLTISNNNAFFSGTIVVNGGELLAAISGALGNQVGNTTVNVGASLLLNSGVTLAEGILVGGPGFGGTGALNLLANTATITGSVIMTADTTFGANVAGQTLVITGAISETGSFGLIKEGLGNLQLQNTNLFTGSTTVNGGLLQLFQNGSLLSPTITLNLGSTLDLNNSGNVVPDRIRDDAPIFLNASTLTFTGRSGFSVQERVGTITLGQGINAFTTTSTTSASSFMLLESPALVRDPGATVQFNQGSLALGTLSATQGNRILFDTPPALTNGILPFGIVNANLGFATYGANGVALGAITANTIAAGGATSNVRITNNEIVTSSKTINSLTVNGTTGRTVTLSSGATLTIGSGGLLNIGAGAITFTGAGVLNFESPDYEEAFLFDNTAAVTISNAITGALANGLTKAGTNVTTFGGGNAANAYTGTTFANAGTLNLSKNATFLSVPGDLVVGAGAAAATVVWNNSFQVEPTAALTILGNGTANLNNRLNTFGGLTMQGGNANATLLTGTTGNATLDGDVNVLAPLTSSYTQAGRAFIAGTATQVGVLQMISATRTFTIADGAPVNDLEVLAVVSNAGGGEGLTKEGDGVLLLRGNNTYNGPTTINAGTLVVNGNQASSQVTVAPGATLGGGVTNTAGTVLNPLIQGTLRPGQVPGPNAFAGPPNGATVRTQGTLMAQAGADFTQAGALAIEIAGFANQLTDFDRLLVGGNLDVNATSVLIVDLQGLNTTGAALNVMTFVSHNGTFGTVSVVNNPNNFTVIVRYNGSSMDILVTETAMPAPRNRLAVAPAKKGKGILEVYHPQTHALLYTINAFGGKSGVTLASGDVNGDSINDLIASQAGLIRVFDGATGLRFPGGVGQFQPFGNYKGRIYLASGDIDNDGKADIVAGRGVGRSQVKAVSGVNPAVVLTAFRAYEAKFRGGVRVAVGNMDGLPGVEILTAPGAGRKAEVRVFDIDAKQLSNFDVYATPYKRGVFLAVGDLNDDGTADLVVSPGGPNAGAPVKILDGTLPLGPPLAELFPFLDFNGPVQVGITDADGDGFLDVAVARASAGSEVKFFDRTGLALSNIQAFGGTFKGGLNLAASRRA